MFNYVGFIKHQGFELNWWFRMLTKPERVDTELRQVKWTCPFAMCGDELQVLDRCISCKYYTKDDAIITHLQYIPPVPRLRPNEHQVLDMPSAGRQGQGNPEPATKKSKI